MKSFEAVFKSRAAAGAGIPPAAITEVIGALKAYTTAVGEGPFPTELRDGIGDQLREIGLEYGASTGRPRRCGWFDAAAARFNILMYFGDNLRDFSESFAAPKLPANTPPAELRKAIQSRLDRADQAACHWGVDWFVLPNPVYGEWEKLIGSNPIEILHPTTMPAPMQN